MERVSLRGNTISIPRIAFGAEPLGGYDWGDVDLAEMERAVEMALDLGVNFFDTADCYGQGESERRLGHILAGRRDRAVVATKFGVRFDKQNEAYYDNSVAHLDEALDASLKRLGTDYIDLYQLHWPDGRTPLGEVFDRLDRIRESGKIRAYGVTNVEPEELFPHVKREGLATFSLQYSFVHRIQENDILQLCSNGLTFLSWGSLGQGILSGRYDAGHAWPEHDRRRRPQYHHFHGEKLIQNLAMVDCLRDVARRERYPTPAVGALRFILDNIPGSVAIVGVKSRAQIVQNALAGERPMSAENFNRLVSNAISA